MIDHESFLERLKRSRTLDDLNHEIISLRDLFGVRHVIYHSVNSIGQQYAALTYSPEWVARYLEQDYARIDPVVLACLNRFQPVDWKALDWSSKAAREFLKEAIEYGVGHQGFSVPIRGPSGQFALFTVSDDRDDDAWAEWTRVHRNDVILMSHNLNLKALEIERGSDVVQGVSLSPREIDSLTMLARGRSRAQAANELEISEHTLRVYIESARHKLTAANTTHAVATALQQGLLVV